MFSFIFNPHLRFSHFHIIVHLFPYQFSMMGIFRYKVATPNKINEFRVEYSILDDVYICLGPPLDRAIPHIYDHDT